MNKALSAALATILSLIISSARAEEPFKVFDLTGEWELSDASGEKVRSVPAVVPGDVHSALLESGIIEDTYYSTNELDALWVGREDWVFRRRFTLESGFLSHRSILLRAEDVDTFCDITINGHALTPCTNRFRRWEWEVKPYLKEGENVIEGHFHSAEIESEKRAAALSRPIPLIRDIGKVPHINLIRKPACHGGWDWGLTQMVTGFCGPVQLLASDIATIKYIWCDQDHSAKGRVGVKVHVEVESPSGGRTALKVRLGEVSRSVNIPLEKGINTIEVPLVVKKPRLWWPAGMGEQYLYDLEVEIGGSVHSSKLGLRTVEMVSEPDKVGGKDGRSMVFKINGRRVYARGANWIPCDAYETRQTPERYRDILSSCRDANMNMVRLWGGGQFEHEPFYEICDSLGLMIWHDFMFSCSTYPSSPEFLSEVREELTHQIKRLRDHCSIAMWCGDNECVGALGWFDVTRKNRDWYVSEYDKLVKLRAELVEQFDPGRVYWPSSPCAGPGDYSTDNWKEDSKGDMHLWSVSKEALSLSEYYKTHPRFVSEFGHSSYSSLALAKQYCRPGQVSPWSTDFKHHQKEQIVDGNAIVMNRIALHFNLPPKAEDYFYLSQAEQAMGLCTAARWWRTLEPDCMGTIIWQLNDFWPGSSWSLIEYDGGWKQSCYAIRRAYAPYVISAVPSSEGADIMVVNESVEKCSLTARAEIWSFAGKLLSSEDFPVEASYALAARAGSLPPVGGDAFAYLSLIAEDGTVLATDTYIPGEYKDCALEAPSVSVKAALKGSAWTVTLLSDAPAFFVWLAAEGVRGHFSDNSITLLPGRPVELTFTPSGNVSFEEFAGALKVTDLASIYEKSDPALARDLDVAGTQFAALSALYEKVPVLPRSWENGKYWDIKPFDWTSGFFPGSLWLYADITGKKEYADYARLFTARLKDVPFYKKTHDLGFMVLCSYGRQWLADRDSVSREAIIQASKTLIGRFDPKVGAIRSWDWGKWNYPVIIDNMMNLEMLFVASELTGDLVYRDIAVRHADKTLANHFRPDASSWHVVSYNADGSVECKQTHQGYSDDSRWARGQAWGLYGFTVCYRYTHDPRYLDQACRIADMIIGEVKTEDAIPWWDYDAPDIPSAPRDASAAAITASALLELQGMVPPASQKRYLDYAKRILASLSSSEYLAEPLSNGFFILKHSTGNAPGDSEVDVPLNYADYYFLEALQRYLAVNK